MSLLLVFLSFFSPPTSSNPTRLKHGETREPLLQVITSYSKRGKSVVGGRVKLHPPVPIYVDELPFDLNPSG
ncbi:unnamed protein product [Larinioides sclopetarius]|uniref:Uncharacterized protein n=1 Tax=Larinioides sclopetarius TaxID=280406 RepID=A0AAV2ADG5_9ARAC